MKRLRQWRARLVAGEGLLFLEVTRWWREHR